MLSVDKISSLENHLKEMDQVDIPMIERLMGSLYVRSIKIPQGAAITSKVYKRTYADIMVSGDITITDTNGQYRLSGFNILEGNPGRKRAGFAHEDTLWVTVHDCFDVVTDPIHDIAFDTVGEWEAYRKKQDNHSYQALLDNSQFSQEEIDRDQAGFELVETGLFDVKDSPIHGVGLFSKARIESGENLGCVLVGDKKTELGKYINHSEYPNCANINGNIICGRALDAGQEITINYRHTPRGRLCAES